MRVIGAFVLAASLVVPVVHAQCDKPDNHRVALFGDIHIHTGLSADAMLFGEVIIDPSGDPKPINKVGSVGNAIKPIGGDKQAQVFVDTIRYFRTITNIVLREFSIFHLSLHAHPVGIGKRLFPIAKGDVSLHPLPGTLRANHKAVSATQSDMFM